MVNETNSEHATNTYLRTILDRLRLAENLWLQMSNNQGDQASFARLANLAREIAHLARNHDDSAVTGLAKQLEHHIGVAAAAHSVSQEQGKIMTLINKLRRTLTERGEDFAVAPAMHSATPTELLVVAHGDNEQLIAQLVDTGFRVRHLATTVQADAALAQGTPLALITDMDFPDEPLGGIKLVTKIRTSADLPAPVFVMAERDGIGLRLEAVQAGATGYFTKPLDIPMLLNKLQGQLFPKAEKDPYRVLIVDEAHTGADTLNMALAKKQIASYLLQQPLQVLQEIRDFKPDLVVLDLDLITSSGIKLYQVLRQHPLSENMPLMLLSNNVDLKHHLSYLDGENDDLLSKPVNVDYLAWFIQQRLRHRKLVRARLNALSNKDTVTDLYNRRYFLAQLERSCNAYDPDDAQPLAVVLIMLENMRAIRETVDAAAVDEVIGWAARCLKEALPSDLLVARFGDALFAVMLCEGADDTLRATARSVRNALESGFYKVDEHLLQLKTCVGISVSRNARPDFLELIQQADFSCTLARERQDEHIHLHHPQTDKDAGVPLQQQLLKDIREAIERDRMKLVFQPIISLQGDRNERYEVFLRIRNQEDRELVPETVFGAIQDHRLGLALDRWVIAQCIRLLRERRHRTPTTGLFINISAATLEEPTLPLWLRERLEKAQIDPGLIVFELSETAARDHLETARVFIDNIHALGCGFALKRFALQQESIDLLSDLPADYIKPYIEFVHDIIANKAKRKQLQSLVAELKDRGVITVASGVDDLHALPVLWNFGISLVQGFFLQRPLQEMSYDFSASAF